MSTETDLVRASARDGHLVLVEEVTRDGAEGRTLLDADQRIAIARVQARMFGHSAPGRLVFVAGLPAIGREEAECVQRVCEEVDTCQVQVLCPMREADLRDALDLAARARHGRTQMVVPASEAMSLALVHCPPVDALERAVGLVEAAREHSPKVALDICLTDIGRADPWHLVDACNRLTAAGAATITLADAVGCLYPDQLDALLVDLYPRLDPEVVLHLQLHDDLGLAMANALAGLRHGVRIFSGAWLGLGQRAGLLATEQLLGTLSLADGREGRSAIGLGLFDPPLDLPRLGTLARRIAVWLDLPLRPCEPFVGDGVHTTTTGTPLIDPPAFRPYDPARLGLSSELALTHLSNARVVTRVAAEMGFDIGPMVARAATAWVKAEAYRRGKAEVERAALAEFLRREGIHARDGA